MPELMIDRILQPKNTWAFQVIQHAVSLAAHMPVRIWDKTLAQKNLSDRVEEERREEILMTGEFFSGLPERLIHRYKDKKNTGWLTLPCNVHPLVATLRRNPYWLVWEHCFMWKWLRMEPEGPDTWNYYFHRNMRMSAIPLPREDSRDGHERFVVLGPMFVPPEEATGAVERSAKNMAEELVGSVLGALDRAEVRHGFNARVLSFAGIRKGWLSQECFKAKTNLLRKVFRSTFSVNCDLDAREPISNSVYNSVAQIVFMLHDKHRPDQEDIVDVRGNYHLCFSVGIPKHGHVLVATTDSGGWKLDLLNKTRPAHRRRVWLEPEPPSGDEHRRVRKYDVDMGIMRGEQGLDFANTNDGYVGSQTTELYDWINREFGIVATELTEDATKAFYKDSLRRLARRILELFTADVVTIAYHEWEKKSEDSDTSRTPEQRILIPHAMYCHELPSGVAIADVEAREGQLLKQAAESKGTRTDEIGYRVIDSNSAHFTRAAEFGEDDRWVYDPTYEALYNYRSHKIPTRRCCIAVPLMVHGTVFGVIKVEGYRPYQFRLDQMNLALRIADIVGPVLFEREILRRLYNLMSDILVVGTDQKKHARICSEVSQLFLADGSMLWVRRAPKKDEEQDWFRLAAWHNIPLPSNYPCEIPDAKLVKSGDVLPGIARETDRPFEAYSIGNQTREWEKDYDHRRILREAGFDIGLQFPVRPLDKTRLLCFFTVYFRERQEEQAPLSVSAGWFPTMRFVSYYLAILVEAMKFHSDELVGLLKALKPQLKARAHDLELASADASAAAKALDKIATTIIEHVDPEGRYP